MNYFLLACAGGALGAGSRHLVNIAAMRVFGLEVPWATFTVNVVGSLAMGLLIAFIVHRMPEAVALRIFAATGFLGGFTTFSAFSLDAFSLLERGDIQAAMAYILGSVLLSIGACVIGYLGMRMLLV